MRSKEESESIKPGSNKTELEIHQKACESLEEKIIGPADIPPQVAERLSRDWYGAMIRICSELEAQEVQSAKPRSGVPRIRQLREQRLHTNSERSKCRARTQGK